MELPGILQFTWRKFWIAVILFFFMPAVMMAEVESCPDPWEAYVFDMGEPCTTETVPLIFPFYGMIMLDAFFFSTWSDTGERFLDIGLWPELIPSLLIHLALSYVLGCLLATYVFKPKAPPAKKAGKK